MKVHPPMDQYMSLSRKFTMLISAVTCIMKLSSAHLLDLKTASAGPQKGGQLESAFDICRRQLVFCEILRCFPTVQPL